MDGLIDLDAPDAGPRVLRKASGRWWKPAVAVALLLVLGGAAPAGMAPPVAADTAGRGALTAALTEEALYTVHLLGSEDRDTEIRAWPLRPGGPHWTARVGGLTTQLTLINGVLIADAGQEDGLTVFDARTGAVRWRTGQGRLTALLRNGRVAVSGPGAELRVADPATGNAVWSQVADVGRLLVSADRVVAVSYAYRATVYDAETGRVLIEVRDLGVGVGQPGLTDPDAFIDIVVVGDQLYLYGGDGPATFRVAAFNLGDDLTPRWSTSLGQPLDLAGCAAAAICVRIPDGMTVLDPATGRVRWTSGRFVSVSADGIAADRDGRVARVDPATGAVERELGHGAVTGDLLLRTNPDHTVVAGLADGRVRGILPPVTASRCLTAGRYLACPTAVLTGSGKVAPWTAWKIS
jgi:putative pyrroloquinoline-quinone binding quinoprotein